MIECLILLVIIRVFLLNILVIMLKWIMYENNDEELWKNECF